MTLLSTKGTGGLIWMETVSALLRKKARIRDNNV